MRTRILLLFVSIVDACKEMQPDGTYEVIDYNYCTNSSSKFGPMSIVRNCGCHSKERQIACCCPFTNMCFCSGLIYRGQDALQDLWSFHCKPCLKKPPRRVYPDYCLSKFMKGVTPEDLKQWPNEVNYSGKLPEDNFYHMEDEDE